MNFKSINDLVSDVKRWSEQIDFDYDYIVGIHQSGSLVAHLLSAYVGKPVKPNYSDRAFVVDDSLMSGKTMSCFLRAYPQAKCGAVYVKPGMEKRLDTYYQTLAPPRIFEWNLFKSAHLEQTMMDIDGILCRDPTKAECDYGLKMLEFYSTVKPRIIPSRRPGWLVTCRLDKYRPVTMDWLAEYKIDCNSLIMRQRRSQGHGEFKAGIYAANAKAKLFIESSTKQACQIARLSGKPVLCYSTMEML